MTRTSETFNPGTAVTAPGQQPPQLFSELNPTHLIAMADAASTLTLLPLPETARDVLPEAARPALDRRVTLGLIAARSLPLLTDALPAFETIKSHVEAGTDITAEELTGHIPMVRALAPLAQKALDVAPGVIAGTDYDKRQSVREKINPITTKLRLLRAASAVAPLLGLRKKLDAKLADAAATYINTHREEIGAHLDTAYNGYVEPFGRALESLTKEYPRPRERFMLEARMLANAIWHQAGATNRHTPESRIVGHALADVLQASEYNQTRFPLLSKLVLRRMPRLPQTIAIDDSFGVRMGLDLSGTRYSAPYTVEDKYGEEQSKINISTRDALGVCAEEIMSALEVVATPDPRAAHWLSELGDRPHRLRSIIKTFSGSTERQLMRLRAFGDLLQAALEVLPEDAAHANRISSALQHTFQLKRGERPRP